MTEIQKQLIRALLKFHYNNGFSCSCPLTHLAEKLVPELNLTPEQIYDSNSESGILWEYGDHESGYLYGRGNSIGVTFEVKDLLENWSDFRY